MGYIISRVQVEEGFLDGLDVSLVPGLNVIIGGRGTGKTSLIELIRFCLGAPGFTEEAIARGRQQALSVLQGGKVTLTLSSGDDMITVARTADDARPRATSPFPSATVLAQNEIEAVGAKEEGRLHLIDRCRSDAVHLRQEATARSATLRAQTTEIETLLRDVDNISEKLQRLGAVDSELGSAMKEQEDLLKSVEATQADAELLNKLQQAGTQLAVREAVYERSKETVGRLRAYLDGAPVDAVVLEPWPLEAGGDDELEETRDQLSNALGLLRQSNEIVASASATLDDLIAANEAKKVQVDERSRELRKKLNVLKEGADVLTRRVNELREMAGQRQALIQYLDEMTQRLERLMTDRRAVYEELDALRDTRFQSRQAIAKRVTDQLDPPIRVQVSRSARRASMTSAIESALRGSGLHRSTLAPVLADSLAPIELVEAVERQEAAAIASAAKIPLDRAGAVVSQIRTSGAADIISAAIGDSVELELLDGVDYKPSRELSIGQRCTVVLPILLAEAADILIVDQPEDHLDNAYIAATLVPALRNRAADTQILFSSHNANIPVLGDADRVILLDSDGRRGFQRHAGPLDDPETIKAITDVMEGGKEAFKVRGRSYGMTFSDDG